jgi:hypothetical protein
LRLGTIGIGGAVSVGVGSGFATGGISTTAGGVSIIGIASDGGGGATGGFGCGAGKQHDFERRDDQGRGNVDDDAWPACPPRRVSRQAGLRD